MNKFAGKALDIFDMALVEVVVGALEVVVLEAVVVEAAVVHSSLVPSPLVRRACS